MKKMLFRKLLLDYMSFFIIALLSSSIVIWVFQAVNFLDIMIEDGRDYTVYLKYSLLNFPKILSKLFPFVLFFSLFHVTNRYENNNELVIFWNFGVTKIELINFVLKFSIILMVLLVILSSFIVPKTQDLAKSFLRTSTVNFYGNFIKPQKFNDIIKNVTIYSEKKDDNGNLYNLYLKKQESNNNFQITYAQKGIFKEISNIPVLVLYNGATITARNNELTNFSFSKSDFLLNNFKSNTTTYKKTQETSSFNLIKCIRLMNMGTRLENRQDELKNNVINCTINNLYNVNRELYKRFIVPLYLPLLCLIPFFLILSSKENLNYQKFKTITFITGLFFIIVSETSIKIVTEINFQNLIISSIPIILLLIIYILFLSKTNYARLK